MITRENYEAFFLDYHEGALSENQQKELMGFLEENPDLKDEFYSFSQVILPKDHAEFTEKNKLYQAENDVDDKLIAFFEGDLNPEEKKSFEKELAKDRERQKEFNLLKRTKLIPDTNIRFENKKSLYKQSTRTITFKWISRVAAVFVLLFAIGWLFKTINQKVEITKPTTVAENTPVIDKPVEKEKTNVAQVEENNLQNQLEPKGNIVSAIKKKQIQKPVIEEKNQFIAEREMTEIKEIPILPAKINQVEMNLASLSGHIGNKSVPHSDSKYITLDEYLANKAMNVKEEGIVSVNKIAKIGLAFASQLSGKRINYKENNSKVTSIEYESKLLAFTIPLEK